MLVFNAHNKWKIEKVSIAIKLPSIIKKIYVFDLDIASVAKLS